MLSAKQLSQFNENGYLVIDDIVELQVLKAVIAEYDQRLSDLCADWINQGLLEHDKCIDSFEARIRAAYNVGLDYFQPLDISLPPGDIEPDTPFHAGPAIYDLITSQQLLNAVESLIGSEITSNPIQHVRIKPPATDLYCDEVRAHITSTDWHQDRAVTLESADTTEMVTVWVAITDATLDNGCLQVIPKSHQFKMLRHCPLPQLSIPTQEFNVHDAVALPVKAGGAILFHPNTIHSSRVNNSDTIRWSFDLRYNVTGHATGRPMFPDFVVRSRKHPETVSVNADQWQTLWQEARARLAAARPVVIHRWAEDSNYCA